MSKLKFYTIKEFAKILTVSEKSIREWIKEGILKCFKAKGIIRIPESEIERLINNSEKR